MINNDIYTWDNFPEEINTEDYHLNRSKEVLEGVLVCKRKNINGNIVAYVNLDTKGKKIKGLKFSAFEDNHNYMGLENIPIGSRIRVRYRGEKYYLYPDTVEVI